MAVGYSLNHVQAASTAAAPPYTWIDIPGSVNWEPTVESDSEEIMADGSVYVTAYGNPVGSGDLMWIDDILAVRALLNGGTVSTTGISPSIIERYELPGTYVPVPFALSDWVPNIDRFHDPDVAGTRTTAPNCTAGVISRTSGQETVQELTATTSMTQDANGVMLIVEKLETSPVFTNGVTEGGV